MTASHSLLSPFAAEVYSLLCSLEPGVSLSPTQILDRLGYPEDDRKDYYTALRRLASGALSHCIDRSPPVLRYGKAIRYYRWHKPSAIVLPDAPSLAVIAGLQSQITKYREELAELRSEMAKLRSCLPSP